MNHPQIYKIQLISLVLATAFLTTPGIAKEKTRINVIQDQSYSLTPNVVRQTELWETTKGQMLLVTEYYCPGHSNYGEVRHMYIRPPSEDWSDFGKPHPDSQMGQLRDSACQLLSEGEFELENVQDYSSLGYRLSESYRLQEAVDVYRKAIELYPNYAEAHNNRGIARAQLGDYQGAIEDYKQAIRINPKYAEAYYNRGDSYSDLEDYQEAIDDFTQVIRINPNLGSAYYNRGNAYLDLENYQGAIDDYTQAIKINPNMPQAYYNRGNVHSKLGEHQRAIDDYTQSLRTNHYYPYADGRLLYAYTYNNRALSYKKLGRRQQAIKDFQAAADIHRQLGNRNLYQRAIDQIRKLR